MSIARQFLLVCLGAAALAAQDSGQGVAAPWDLRATLRGIVDGADQYKLLVERLKPSDWVAKGASEGYINQARQVQTEAGYLATVSRRLSASPENIALALDVFFRLQAIESVTVSLAEAASRYQDSDLAQQLNQSIAKNGDARGRLRQYVLDLSTTKEEELSVAIKEAQRCQAIVNRNPLAPVRRTPKPAEVKK